MDYIYLSDSWCYKPSYVRLVEGGIPGVVFGGGLEQFCSSVTLAVILAGVLAVGMRQVPHRAHGADLCPGLRCSHKLCVVAH